MLATRKLSSLWSRAKYGFQGNKPSHAEPQDWRQDEVFAIIYSMLQRELCNIYACLLRVCNMVHSLVFCCRACGPTQPCEINGMR